MGVRLEPRDEHLHELGPEPNFNESMYFNVFDPSGGIGGWFRLGNRANEGYAEMTVCVYLPGGRVAFTYARPPIADNSAFDAGGMRFEVLEPFQRLEVAYQGDVVVLDRPLDMADPGRAFTGNPHAPCDVRLSFRGASAMYGGEPDEPHERPGEEFARGHYEQLVGARGSIRVGDEEWAVDGHGLRDHSWGPRSWQAPWYYRWLTAAFDDGFGFMGSRIARREGGGTRGGFVWEGGRLHVCDHLEVSTAWTGDDRYHRSVSATLRSGSQRWDVEGEVVTLIPLRNRRTAADGSTLTTRISEAMTRWTLADGRVGFGMSEYLDQIVDGSPVGVDE